jgi:hypothetical protein
MTQVFKISDQGRQKLQEGGLSPEEDLLLEIMSRVQTMSQENCIKIAIEATNICGSAEKAIEMFRAGMFELEKLQ